MILIPEGIFRMGTTDEELATAYRLCEATLEGRESECTEQGFETEMPANEVTLDSFYIDKFEITNAQYAELLKDRQNRIENGIIWYEDTDDRARIQLGSSGWQVVQGFEDHPVTEVTWFGARAYCQWRGGRLPTEAEWEKAARWNPETGDVTLFPWGDNPPNHTLANYAGGVSRTEPVGRYPAGESAAGLQDMAGNVFEWVNDWHSPDYYSLGEVINPQGPDNGSFRVIKGGSWGDFDFLIRSANRGTVPPGVAFNYIGFRCVKDVSAAQE
jgi:formylglycine-generating enzyme required for sulfatase activity